MPTSTQIAAAQKTYDTLTAKPGPRTAAERMQLMAARAVLEAGR